MHTKGQQFPHLLVQEEDSPHVCVVTDPQGLLIQGAAELRQFLKKPPFTITPRSFFQWFPEEIQEDLRALTQETLEDQQSHSHWAFLSPERGLCFICVRCLSNLREKSGAPPFIEFSIFNPPVELAVNTDLLQSHQLVNLGSLATGVAHDLNNLFTGVLSFAYLLKRKLQDPVLQNHALLIERTIEKASSLTKGILSQVKGEENEEPSDPISCIRDMISLVNRTLSHQIVLTHHLPSKSHPIGISRSQLSQIVLNLLINARDAIATQGNIHVECAYRTKEEHTQLQLSFSDNGVGISPRDLPFIFTPFFSTKEKSQGTGLGLSMVQQIVERAGGTIEVNSSPGNYTKFTVILPVVPRLPRESHSSPLPMGKEDILVAGLSPSPGEPVKQVLEAFSYRVSPVHWSSLEQPTWSTSPTPAKLAVIDCEQNIKEALLLAKGMIKKDPEMTILICACSSDSQEPVPQRVHFITKPFSPPQLLKTVQSLLDS